MRNCAYRLPRAVLLLLPAALMVPAAVAQCVEDCTVIHDLVGEALGDQFGWVSNDIADLDGDGVREFLITAPTNDAGGASAGRVYVYDGASGTELFHVTGQAGWWLGHDATEAGDINNDGTTDIIVGAPFAGAGRAIIYSGVDGTLIHQFNGAGNGDQFGFRVHGGRDFNGDGRPDIAIGAPGNDQAGTNAGRAYVYSGATLAPICILSGQSSFDNFGSGVWFVGDVSQPPDGRDDLAVGAMNAGSGSIGEAYVYAREGSSCVMQYVLNPVPAVGTNFGQWFMNGGFDVNADGTPDIYVNDFGVNRAHIFSGVDGSHLFALSGDGRGGFGIGRLIDDVNNDGAADMILAAWDSDLGAPSAGKAFVYSGADQAVLETFTHDVPGAQFGFDANGMGDVNGDGRFDYLVTAAWDTGQRGRAYVVAGTIGGLPADFNGDGEVGPADLALLLDNWGPCPTEGECLDLNGDGIVGPADLASLLDNWT